MVHGVSTFRQERVVIRCRGVMVQPNNTGAPRAAVPSTTMYTPFWQHDAAHALYGHAVLSCSEAHIHQFGTRFFWFVLCYFRKLMNRVYVGGVTATPAAMVDGCNLAKRHALRLVCKFICCDGCVVAVIYQNFRIEPRFITIIFIVRL